MEEIKLGYYRHWKGKFYKVLSVARDSETLEEVIVYQAMYDSKDFGDNAIWTRPKKSFLEEVEIEGKKVKRFEEVEEEKFS